MAPVCHNFVQNAWKKDFCSNCFKSRDDHARVGGAAVRHASPRAAAAPTPAGILRARSGGAAGGRRKRAVSFPDQPSSVIGYGGDGWSDEDEDECGAGAGEEAGDDADDDPFPDTDEERALHKLTKCNTDFNSEPSNLLVSAAAASAAAAAAASPPPRTTLLLGRARTDAEGNRKTLMVSVTPFGQDGESPGRARSHARRPPLASPAATAVSAPPPAAPAYKTHIVLSTFVRNDRALVGAECGAGDAFPPPRPEKSLLEEISETLEQNRMSAASAEPRTTRSGGDGGEGGGAGGDGAPTVVDERVKPDRTSDCEDKKDTSESKKNGLMRNSPIIKSQERPKVTLNGRSEFKFCKISIESASGESATSVECAADGGGGARGSFTSDDDSLGGRTDSDNEEGRSPARPPAPMPAPAGAAARSPRGPRPDERRILDMPPIMPAASAFAAGASREFAGEPDGRAEPDSPPTPPPPASAPPPPAPLPSFLHGVLAELQALRPDKPKLPVKPLSVIKQCASPRPPPPRTTAETALATAPRGSFGSIRHEPNGNDYALDEPNNKITETKEELPETALAERPALTKRDSDSSIELGGGKRKAPAAPPPPSSPLPAGEDGSVSKYQRNPSAGVKSASPVVREKEKRERASFTSGAGGGGRPDDDAPAAEAATALAGPPVDGAPEPAPRRNISLSHDNLLLEDKRKGKLKFSIRKLLRIGSSKELDRKELSAATVSRLSPRTEEAFELAPKPKPRLVIIHPLELNGSAVEVVRRRSHDSESVCSSLSESSAEAGRSKPPPPPRAPGGSVGGDEARRTAPARPPPPTSANLQKQQKQQGWSSAPPLPAPSDHNIYANLGEVRSAIAPRKPERTASMRERDAQLELALLRRAPPAAAADCSDSDDADASAASPAPPLVEATNEQLLHSYDDVYHSAAAAAAAEAAVEEAAAEYEDVELGAAAGALDRSSSLPYCGSETESEIYSPFGFYGEGEGGGAAGAGTNEAEEEGGGGEGGGGGRLRVRKGRSVVHRSLEDNYGAVVIANHEALAQVLEQVQQQSAAPPAGLRALRACSSLRWSDFGDGGSGERVRCGRRVFRAGVWSGGVGAGAGAGAGAPVTLMVHAERMSSQLVSQQALRPQTLSLNAITEFCDFVPRTELGEHCDGGGVGLVQATVVVLPPAAVETLAACGARLAAAGEGEGEHEAAFTMLQLLTALRWLQARGVDSLPADLSSFAVLRDAAAPAAASPASPHPPPPASAPSAPASHDTARYGRLCVLQGLCEPEREGLSLCAAAAQALARLPAARALAAAVRAALAQEAAGSLAAAAAALEWWLWGPADAGAADELCVQRWLDLERATVLHGLVRARVHLTTFEQLHLAFLVRATARALCRAERSLHEHRHHPHLPHPRHTHPHTHDTQPLSS